MKKLRVAIIGLTSCSGCQLSIINCEDELSEILEHFDFSYFPLVASPSNLTGEYDAVLVEGCVSKQNEIKLLKELRKRTKNLIAIGTCAAWGGISALDNNLKTTPSKSQPLKKIVHVDAVITGCPPEKNELIRFFAAILRGSVPAVTSYPVCSECKMNENICLLTELNKLCLGPLTLGGCAATCPSSSVPCEGCRGPLPEANLKEFFKLAEVKGFNHKLVTERLKRFCMEWEI